jgi:hypothetical protein
MKEYSISQIIHIDSPSLISIIENFERYTKNTVVITNAELDRRNLLTTELNFKIKEFSSINNITDIKATFLSILDNQG